MFSVGDKIIYGSMGVCTIVDICVPDLPGATRKCYLLKPHYVANSKVYAPVEENPVKMRPLLTPAQAKSLIDNMPKIKTFPPDGERQEQYNTYRSVIKSADSFQLVKLMKTLYEKKLRILEQKKIVPSVEKEYFDTAEKMVCGEMAAALEISIEAVKDYITAQINSAAPQPALS